MGLNFPEEFNFIEEYSAWILESERERFIKRKNSTMSEMTEIYETCLPRLEIFLDFFDKHSRESMDLNQQIKNLYLFFVSLIEISMAVERFKEPDEQGVFDGLRLIGD